MPAARVEWCRPEQVPDVMRLIDSAWKPGHVLSRDRELFEWQYRRRADGTLSLLLLIDESLGPVGVLGAIPIEFNACGTTMPGAMLALWFVQPDYPDKSAGLQLLRALLSLHNGFIGVLGVRESALPLYRAMRFHVVPRIDRWVRGFDAAALRELLAERPDAYPSDFVDHPPPAAATSAPPAATNLDIVAWRPDLAASWDTAWHRDFAPKLVGPSRRAADLAWRYVEHPRFDYAVRVAVDRKTAEPAGLLVYRLAEIRDRSERVLRIVEFLARPGAEDVLAAEVDRIGRREHAAFADFYCTSASIAEPLARFGFAREPADGPTLPALLQPLDFGRSVLNGAFYLASQSPTELFSGDDVYFTRSDGDQDRPA